MSESGKSDKKETIEAIEDRCKLVEHLKFELVCAKIVFLICAGLLFILLFSMALGCGHMRLPDRDHPACTIPYSQRPVCITDSECATGFLCAKRGWDIGRCTYQDCCEPWRNRRLEGGGSFCESDNISKPVLNVPECP